MRKMPLAECGVCGRMRAVKQDGTLILHRPLRATGVPFSCDGSGKEPRYAEGGEEMTVVVCGQTGYGECKPDEGINLHVCQIRHEKGRPHTGYHVCGTCKRQFF